MNLHWWMFIPAAFLAGSIPFGFLIARINGIDIRTVGSGNIGATNLGRVLGKRFFYACFFLDMTKGMMPTMLAGHFMGTLGTMKVGTSDAYWWMGVMIASVLGHMFTPWLKFKGGKGVATGMGAMVGILPAMSLPAAGALVVYLMVVVLWRYVSLASSAAAASLPLWTWVVFAQYHTLMVRQSSRRTDWDTLPAQEIERIKAEIPNYGTPFFVVAILLAVLVVYKHRGNLQRIIQGIEPQIGEKLASQPGIESGTQSVASSETDSEPTTQDSEIHPKQDQPDTKD
jgi:acyl phosphate:glycerol-3-phosphate acyltransferase